MGGVVRHCGSPLGWTQVDRNALGALQVKILPKLESIATVIGFITLIMLSQ
jgi:hypothetical protein